MAENYNRIAGLYFSKGEYKKAIDCYNKAFEVIRNKFDSKHSSVATYYNNLGLLHQRMQELSWTSLIYRVFNLSGLLKKKYSKSIEYYNKSIEILKDSEEKETYLITINNLINLYFDIGEDYKKSILLLQEAIKVVLESRFQIIGQDKQFITNKYYHFFQNLIFLYTLTNESEMAFEISEKMRGLSILENFQLEYALRESGVSNNIISKIFNLKGKSESLNSQISAVIRQGEKGISYIKILKDKLLKIKDEFRKIDEQLMKNNKYRENRNITIPKIDDLQVLLKSTNQVFLEYILTKEPHGNETLSVFVVSKDKFESVILAKNQKISLLIHNLRQIISVSPKERIYILAKDLNNSDFILSYKSKEFMFKYPNSKSLEPLREFSVAFEPGTEIYREEFIGESKYLQNFVSVDITSTEKKWTKFAVMERRIRINVNKNDYEATDILLPKYLKELYQILVEPLYEKGLIKTKDIIISPDSLLFTIPFSALITNKGKYWCKESNITLIHSASIWTKLIKFQNRNYPQTIYAMGNPVYSNKHSATREIKLNDLRDISKGNSLEDIELKNLKGTELELDHIGNTFYKTTNIEHIQSGFSANKNELLDRFSDRIPKYKIVHFAVHGLFFPENFELNSLALTSRVKAISLNKTAVYHYEKTTGKKIAEDGFFKTGEVIELGIKTELLVMSACNTSLGTEYAGEGMIGLPQAFLMAGAQNVLATLWSVDDIGTMLFFEKFYQYYPNKFAVIGALHKTQLEIMQDEKYKDPYFWAPFVVFGE